MLGFKDFLIEAKLDQDDLKKLKDGIERWKIVLQWVNDPKKEVEIDGVKTKIKFISKEHELAFIDGNYKIGSRYQPLFTDGKNNYRINDIDKIPEFGGGSGSGGGASRTKDTESAQCVYAQAYWDNNKTQFTPEDIKSAYAKVDVDAKLDDILNINSDWKMSCITGARILKQAVKGKTMKFHRGSSWVKKLGTRWKKLNKDAGFPFSDLNKWNPADIWLVGDDTAAEGLLDAEKYQTLETLNSRVHELFKSKTLYGVSLKLMKGATHVDSVNFRPEKKVPKYKSKTIGKVNFYNSKDVYLNYEDGEIQFRGFGGKLDNWQGELGGAHAKLGKIGRGSINAVLKKPTVKKALGTSYELIPDEAKLLKEIEKDRGTFIRQKLYPLASSKKIAGDKKVIEKEDAFVKKLKGKSDTWLKSKYLGLLLFKIIQGKESLVTQSLITYASSQDDLSSAHLKLM